MTDTLPCGAVHASRTHQNGRLPRSCGDSRSYSPCIFHSMLPFATPVLLRHPHTFSALIISIRTYHILSFLLVVLLFLSLRCPFMHFHPKQARWAPLPKWPCLVLAGGVGPMTRGSEIRIKRKIERYDDKIEVRVVESGGNRV